MRSLKLRVESLRVHLRYESAAQLSSLSTEITALRSYPLLSLHSYPLLSLKSLRSYLLLFITAFV